MKIIKLKDQFKNSVVRRGTATIDTSVITPSKFQYFYDNGFSDLFEVEQDKPEPVVKEESKIEIPKAPAKSKTKKK